MKENNLRTFNLKTLQTGFSLMEMMVVLLIVAIIAAATAPVVTKKMSRNMGTGDSPWIFTGNGRSIAFNPSGAKDGYAIIGAPRYNRNGNNDMIGPDNPRLVLAGGTSIAYADDNGNYTATFSLGNSEIKIGSGDVGDNSVFVGTNVSASGMDNVTAIGSSIAANNNAVIIGTKMAAGENAVVIGSNDNANQITSDNDSVAVGYKARAAEKAVAIGSCARANINDSGTSTNSNGIAIGYNAKATGEKSIAIGSGAVADRDNQIVLGTANDTVYIKGNLLVNGDVMLAAGYGNVVNIREARLNRGSMYTFNNVDGNSIFKGGQFNSGSNSDQAISYDNFMLYKHKYVSDRRLKNVGDKYVAGLDELNKLDFYHYTFKKDEAKTPMVGVMAQDLQKVFPDAVVKGDDGFLRIRMDDMFYASLNAIKELNNKIENIISDIISIKTKIQSQQETIEKLAKENLELQQENEELKAEIKNIEKRLKKLEK